MNNICTCGHDQHMHFMTRLDTNTCGECFYNIDKRRHCDHSYKRDNLRFLESLVYQKDYEQHNRDKSFTSKKVN